MDIINVHTLTYYVFKMIEHKSIDYPKSNSAFWENQYAKTLFYVDNRLDFSSLQ